MKKLYFLDEAETNRILNLHESATKNQYLSEASFGSGSWVSVSYNNYTLTLNNYLEMERRGSGSELKLWKGVIFSRENDNTLVTKPNTTYQLVGDYTGSVEEEGKGTIRYRCKTKEFEIEGRNAKFWGEDFQSDVQKAFDALCDELPTGKSTTDTGKTQEFKFPCVKISGGKVTTLKDGSLAYVLNGETYYGNGRVSLANGTMGNYYCDGNNIKKGTKTNQKTYVKKTTAPKTINYADYGL